MSALARRVPCRTVHGIGIGLGRRYFLCRHNGYSDSLFPSLESRIGCDHAPAFHVRFGGEGVRIPHVAAGRLRGKIGSLLSSFALTLAGT